jgi:hypothetical protein
MSKKIRVFIFCVSTGIFFFTAKADNPLIPSIGMCDSHIRIFEGRAILYSGHDADPKAKTYIMPDWRIFSSDDLVNWKLERTVYPEETYLGKGNTRCYATDAAYRNGNYYFYFSNGKDHTSGVLRGKSPTGPFEDPLKKALLYPELTPMDAEHDPTIFFDDDANQTPYIIFGRSKVEPYHIARLNEDMISLAETPRPIASKGYASDQNFLFKRNGIYYLSFTNNRYVTATNIYGPYSNKTKSAGGYGGHGSYFTWNNQWYRTTNNADTIHHFRKTLMTYVHFRKNGDMVNDPEFYQTGYAYSYGVGQYNAEWPKIQAEWYFASEGVEKIDNEIGDFEIQQISNNDWLKFPNVKNLKAKAKISFCISSESKNGCVIEIREGAIDGKLLGKCKVSATKSWNSYKTVSCKLKNDTKTKGIYLVFKGNSNEFVRLDWIKFN